MWIPNHLQFSDSAFVVPGGSHVSFHMFGFPALPTNKEREKIVFEPEEKWKRNARDNSVHNLCLLNIQHTSCLNLEQWVYLWFPTECSFMRGNTSCLLVNFLLLLLVMSTVKFMLLSTVKFSHGVLSIVHALYHKNVLWNVFYYKINVPKALTKK